MLSTYGTLLVALTAAVQVETPVTLAVDISDLGPAPSRERRTMADETREIWSAHGVAITWLESPSQLPHGVGQRIRVLQRCETAEVCESHGSRSAPPRLGAVLFLEGKVVSETTVFLAVETIRGIVDDTRMANRRVKEWPPGVRQELAGRAMGRVLAHEIAHYLLGWRAHTAGGLLRVEFRPDRLIDPDRREFRLSANLLPRLRARLTQFSKPGTRLADTGEGTRADVSTPQTRR